MRKFLQFFKCPRNMINYIAPPTYEDLRVAVIKYDIEKIDLLVQNGVPVFGRGETIIHFCVNEKNIQILKKTCNQFQDLIDQRNDDGDSPFMLAIFQRYQQGIQYLVRRSNINICDNNGNTAFMIAAANGDMNTLRLLLSKNRQCSFVKNFEGQNALHRACYFGQLQTVAFLIKKTHLKFGMKDQKGNTSLHWACNGLSFGVARFIVRKVINWQQNLLINNKDGKNPFQLMIQSINKIGDKNIKYSQQQLQIAIIGQKLQHQSEEVIYTQSQYQ